MIKNNKIKIKFNFIMLFLKLKNSKIKNSKIQIAKDITEDLEKDNNNPPLKIIKKGITDRNLKNIFL